LIFDHSKNLRAPQTCAYATLRQSVANLMFHNVSFNFATAISKFDTFSSYHIICAQIAKVTASSFLFELSELVCTRNLLYPISFFLFELSEFVCTKNVFYPILLFPLLSHPKLLPLWSVPDGQHSSPPVTYFFFLLTLSARGPTCRRNSTGLAELWGGWPIEQGKGGLQLGLLKRRLWYK
jgi:hypothetical protein